MADAPSNPRIHPRPDRNGRWVAIFEPHQPTRPETWYRADEVATFVPAGACPVELHGVPLAPWEDAPRSAEEWSRVAGQNAALPEPRPPGIPAGEPSTVGAVVVEPDGRVWAVHPINAPNDEELAFCNGFARPEIGPQATAIKRVFEQSGLRVEIDGFVADLPMTERGDLVARYYLARRVGGRPTDCGWESQAVSLVPLARLRRYLSAEADRLLVSILQQQSIA